MKTKKNSSLEFAGKQNFTHGEDRIEKGFCGTRPNGSIYWLTNIWDIS